MTTMKNITLKSEETVSGMKGFIVVGTTYVYGEDLPCKGRVSYTRSYTSSHLHRQIFDDYIFIDIY